MRMAARPANTVSPHQQTPPMAAEMPRGPSYRFHSYLNRFESLESLEFSFFSVARSIAI
jgi:hypothetical protein